MSDLLRTRIHPVWRASSPFGSCDVLRVRLGALRPAGAHQPGVCAPSLRPSVESRTGAVACRREGSCCRRLSAFAGASLPAVAPFPVPAHRTGRADFPHPALRLVSRSGSRSRPHVQRPQSLDSELVEDHFGREPPGTSPRCLVATSEKVASTFVDVVVRRSVRHQTGAVVEVVRPAAQNAIQLVSYLGPGTLIPRPQHRADALLEPLDALLRRLRGQIRVAVFPVSLYPKV
jgi:hypothetical protein